MKTDNSQNNNTDQTQDKNGGMKHFFLMFFGFILLAIGLSYVVKWLFL
jgi:hypothetical protein